AATGSRTGRRSFRVHAAAGRRAERRAGALESALRVTLLSAGATARLSPTLRNPDARAATSRRLGHRPHAAVNSQRPRGRLHAMRGSGALLPVIAAALVVGSRANGAAQGRPPCDTGRPPPVRAPAVRG